MVFLLGIRILVGVYHMVMDTTLIGITTQVGTVLIIQAIIGIGHIIRIHTGIGLIIMGITRIIMDITMDIIADIIKNHTMLQAESVDTLIEKDQP